MANLDLPGTRYQNTKFAAMRVLAVVSWLCAVLDTHAHPLADRPCGARPWHRARSHRARARAPAAAVTTATATAAGKMGASSSFFAIPLAPQPTTAAAAPAAAAEVRDDLAKYLALPAETNMDLDVLAWWKAKDCKDGLPALAKMAHQFLGRPASSAGVERTCTRRRASSTMTPRRTRMRRLSRLPSSRAPTPSELDVGQGRGRV